MSVRVLGDPITAPVGRIPSSRQPFFDAFVQEHRRPIGGERAARALLDHLIRPLQERRRDRQAEGLGGLEVDD